MFLARTCCVLTAAACAAAPRAAAAPRDVLVALPYLQLQVPGFGMPAALRLSQLLWTCLEAFLCSWLMIRTWQAWTALALQLSSWLGLAGLWQQVCWFVCVCMEEGGGEGGREDGFCHDKFLPACSLLETEWCDLAGCTIAQ